MMDRPNMSTTTGTTTSSSPSSFNVVLASTLLDIDVESGSVNNQDSNFNNSNSYFTSDRNRDRDDINARGGRENGRERKRVKTGVGSLDRDLPDLFGGGVNNVIGVAGAHQQRSRNGDGGLDGSEHHHHQEDEEEEEAGHQWGRDLTVEVITTHLLESLHQPLKSHVHSTSNRNQHDISSTTKAKGDSNSAMTPKSEPSVFILAPPSSTTISLIYKKLLERLEERKRADVHANTISYKARTSANINNLFTKSRGTSTSDVHKTARSTNHNQERTNEDETALHLLNDICILQYLDLIGLSESLSEVSQSLSTLTTDSPQSDRTEGDRPRKRKTQKVIVYIEGLPHTLTRLLTQRFGQHDRSSTSFSTRSSTSRTATTMMSVQQITSKFTQIAALLTSIMRSIRMISRNGGRGRGDATTEHANNQKQVTMIVDLYVDPFASEVVRELSSTSTSQLMNPRHGSSAIGPGTGVSAVAAAAAALPTTTKSTTNQVILTEENPPPQIHSTIHQPSKSTSTKDIQERPRPQSQHRNHVSASVHLPSAFAHPTGYLLVLSLPRHQHDYHNHHHHHHHHQQPTTPKPNAGNSSEPESDRQQTNPTHVPVPISGNSHSNNNKSNNRHNNSYHDDYDFSTPISRTSWTTSRILAHHIDRIIVVHDGFFPSTTLTNSTSSSTSISTNASSLQQQKRPSMVNEKVTKPKTTTKKIVEVVCDGDNDNDMLDRGKSLGLGVGVGSWAVWE